MIGMATIRNMVLEYPGVTESPHFQKISFRVKGKIFLTCDIEKNMASCKLPIHLQELYIKAAPGIVSQVPNKWGSQGWTFIDLKKISKVLFREMLKLSFDSLATSGSVKKKSVSNSKK